MRTNTFPLMLRVMEIAYMSFTINGILINKAVSSGGKVSETTPINVISLLEY